MVQNFLERWRSTETKSLIGLVSQRPLPQGRLSSILGRNVARSGFALRVLLLGFCSGFGPTKRVWLCAAVPVVLGCQCLLHKPIR